MCVSLSSPTASTGAAHGPPFPSHPISITATSPENWRSQPGPALQPSRAVTLTQPVLGTVMPLAVLWVPLGALGAEGHVASSTPPAASTKGNSEERGININELICTERLSLVPQLDSTQKEG